MEMATCLLGVALLAGAQNPDLGEVERKRVAEGICTASSRYALDPRVLAAYALKENRKFRLNEIVPAAVGYDVGLFQVNTRYHGERPNFRLVLDPVYGADIAAQIIRENIQRFGYTWQGIAAYWSPNFAKKQTIESARYFLEWKKNYFLAHRYFEKARTKLESAQWAVQ